ncbi:protein REVEILLE 6-like isoform X2 [Hibiscus syriacus]|uniref:protein REVEILLE 6-like isoform X2 n=1 Tax=Hibiscus syriacus TaxID=106335 RepID=UPI001920EF62|nr:protein REVEILLE 6-like isoform X2 [Hibiscus syriacus]
MVSVNPNPAPGFYFLDPMNLGLPELNSLPPRYTVELPPPPPPQTSMSTFRADSVHFEDPGKKIRKPYTITKSRESWTEMEHDKFVEALQLFDRDWKKIEAFVGSKTVIQIRSHAQKYFLKAQKNGTAEHVPPPRPKRKAAHPYPQKAPKNIAVVPQFAGPFQSSSALLESGYTYKPDSSSVLGNPIPKQAWPSWSYDSVPPVTVSQVTKDDAIFSGPNFAPNSCYSSSNESISRTWSCGGTIARGDHGKQSRVLPDFSQVYAFIGSVFDPSASGHLQKLKEMDPINVETVCHPICVCLR